MLVRRTKKILLKFQALCGVQGLEKNVGPEPKLPQLQNKKLGHGTQQRFENGILSGKLG